MQKVGLSRSMPDLWSSKKVEVCSNTANFTGRTVAIQTQSGKKFCETMTKRCGVNPRILTFGMASTIVGTALYLIITKDTCKTGSDQNGVTTANPQMNGTKTGAIISPDFVDKFDLTCDEKVMWGGIMMFVGVTMYFLLVCSAIFPKDFECLKNCWLRRNTSHVRSQELTVSENRRNVAESKGIEMKPLVP